MAEWVLDASAILAWIYAEPGAEAVALAAPNSLICSVNVAEIVGKLLDKGWPGPDAAAIAASGSFGVASFDEGLALRTGLLRAPTRPSGLSLGDRACLALAAREGLPVLTADRAWASLDIGVDIRLIR